MFSIPAVSTTPPAIHMGIGGIPDPLLKAAKERVLARLREQYPDREFSLDQIEVEMFRCTEWSDTSLGLPQEGEFYGQVLTPGYVIHLIADGQEFVVHTNGDGYSPVAKLP